MIVRLVANRIILFGYCHLFYFTNLLYSRVIPIGPTTIEVIRIRPRPWSKDHHDVNVSASRASIALQRSHTYSLQFAEPIYGLILQSSFRPMITYERIIVLSMGDRD